MSLVRFKLRLRPRLKLRFRFRLGLELRLRFRLELRLRFIPGLSLGLKLIIKIENAKKSLRAGSNPPFITDLAF
jgi:hypothetical protein